MHFYFLRGIPLGLSLKRAEGNPYFPSGFKEIALHLRVPLLRCVCKHKQGLDPTLWWVMDIHSGAL